MRGEHSRTFGCGYRSPGSSPHARGAPPAVPVPIARAGIIPACAGSTALTCRASSRCEDHPRMRGEHPPEDQPCRARRGSSPHARGALPSALCTCGFLRIIPACAGSTRPARRSRPGSGDHPRMRGEHEEVAEAHRLHEGSSPHARGAQDGEQRLGVGRGIIPACAGSTSSHHNRQSRTEDHPRMRGEHA